MSLCYLRKVAVAVGAAVDVAENVAEDVAEDVEGHNKPRREIPY